MTLISIWKIKKHGIKSDFRIIILTSNRLGLKHIYKIIQKYNVRLKSVKKLNFQSTYIFWK